MLRYYSYYSVGGYKDFYLGSSQSDVDATYYLPLLPILEEQAKEDAEAANKLEQLKCLPPIKQLSAEESFFLPVTARTMFSHSGYKLLYRHLEGNYYALALRDLSSTKKDEYNRSIPFMFVITGDTAEDLKSLDSLAVYFASHIKSVEVMLSKYLYMDYEKNGLKFELKKFNDWILSLLSKVDCVLPTTCGNIHIHARNNAAALLVLPEGISMEMAVTEQKLNNMEIKSVKEIEILAKDDPDRLVKQMIKLTEDLETERQLNLRIKKFVFAVGIVCFLIGALIAGCCS